ncbi:acetate/propionate family kinase [Sunxiuqinia elliptica]|uniref:Acetate kinase n=1 Tax=Sunxiuqinia elliptica TaxID=655355 RepID=A0A4R6GWL2_9BACT|nr:acetate kinase [Sunxiuqinia elliptica]TDN99826.1 acetate kinase [Sunxiuqinia elliptica]TDO57018.1 acetate kinase [Sunxiuqinia elliptica]
MKILVLNCGSSSIKYQLFNMGDQSVIAKGGVEKLGMKGSFLKHKHADGRQIVFEGEILDHKSGIEYILGVLTSSKYGCLESLEEIDAVGHRVVHGGEYFASSELINDEVIDALVKCTDLAPLHNPPNLKGIYAMEELIPGIPQVGVFDTAFHQTMEAQSYMYGIPYVLYEKYGIRRYGFHGTSHRYVTKRACELLGVEYENQKIISCHLGNGASIAAVKDGKSFDTSMGFTPIEGLVMGTRSGDLDIGVVTYIMEKEELGLKSANTLFNKHSGMLGLSGVSSDMREIEDAKDGGNERAKMALDIYNYRVRKYIGSYIAGMNGLDVLIFTGGIGENADTTRAGVASELDYLGIKLDESKNNGFRSEGVISTDDSPVKVVVVPTNEELMIALDTEKKVKEHVKL